MICNRTTASASLPIITNSTTTSSVSLVSTLSTSSRTIQLQRLVWKWFWPRTSHTTSSTNRRTSSHLIPSPSIISPVPLWTQRWVLRLLVKQSSNLSSEDQQRSSSTSQSLPSVNMASTTQSSWKKSTSTPELFHQADVVNFISTSPNFRHQIRRPWKNNHCRQRVSSSSSRMSTAANNG